MRIPFCDLRGAHAERGPAIEEALLRAARSGRYVLGSELAAFEEEWAAFCGTDHAVGVGSGTDALALILRASGVGHGDEVVVPAYTAPATWMAVALTGACPVGADVDRRTGLVDPHAVDAAITSRTAALVCVHLFGRLAPMRRLRELADRHGLLLVEDAAHAHGGNEGGIRPGEVGVATAFSFYPTKLLGALGDAGAVVTGDTQLAGTVRQLRSYGQGRPAGDAMMVGVNSRIDELQAAVLRAQLTELHRTLERLRALGRRYRMTLERSPGICLPLCPDEGGEPAWHQFVIAHPERDALRSRMAARGVGTAVHYRPLPPELTVFRSGEPFPAAMELSRQALSLPFDPWLTDAQVDEVCAAAMSASSPRSVT